MVFKFAVFLIINFALAIGLVVLAIIFTSLYLEDMSRERNLTLICTFVELSLYDPLQPQLAIQLLTPKSILGCLDQGLVKLPGFCPQAAANFFQSKGRSARLPYKVLDTPHTFLESSSIQVR